MANITITIPDNKINRVYEVLARAYGDPTENPTNAQKLAFVKSKLMDHLKDLVYADDTNIARNAAVLTVVKDEGIAS